MRRVREVLRLKWELGLSARQVARSCGLTHPTVLNYVRRAEPAGCRGRSRRLWTMRRWSGVCSH